jgi:hypothetical protein
MIEDRGLAMLLWPVACFAMGNLLAFGLGLLRCSTTVAARFFRDIMTSWRKQLVISRNLASPALRSRGSRFWCAFSPTWQSDWIAGVPAKSICPLGPRLSGGWWKKHYESHSEANWGMGPAMKKSIAIGACLLLSGFTPSWAAEYLDRVESPVFTKAGTHQQLTSAGKTCIAQIVKPGLVNAPVIVSADPDSGVVVAINAFEYAYGFLLPVEYQARTTLTFQAKDGRFRIVNTSIEAFFDNQGWRPIGTWSGSGGDAAKTVIDAISTSIAKCVMSGAGADDW